MRKQRIEEMLKESPTDSFLLFALAKEYEKEGNFHQAVDGYRQIVEYDEDYVGVYYHLGAALIEIDAETDLIKEIYEKGFKIAEKLKDQHALAEMKNAYMNWELENL